MHPIAAAISLLPMLAGAQPQKCDADAARPRFSLSTPSPHMVRVESLDGHWLEYERIPPLQRVQGAVEQRHEAAPGTRYRYRARTRATRDCPAGEWSSWQVTRTPREATHAPAAPLALEGSGAPYQVTLQWRSDDKGVDGFVLERCLGDDRCTVAAVLNPDERKFIYHSLKAARFRISAFNAHGYSPPSAMTEVLGEDVAEQDPTDSVELGPADSLAAISITRRSDSRKIEDALCTSPEQLVAEGATLIGVRGAIDLWKSAEGCGTGGCIYTEFTTDNGCYASISDSSVLTHTPPFSGKDDDSHHGVVVTSGSASISRGAIAIYDGTNEVDRYDWEVEEPPFPGRFPPFGTYGSEQYPDYADIALKSAQQ